MIISLDIKKPLLRSYLAYLFEKDSEVFTVSASHDFGRLLCSLVRYSLKPIKKADTTHTVKLKLPKVGALTTADNHHIYFSREDTHKLNMFLEATFNIDFDRYYLDGLQMKYQKKEIISTFIITRKLTGLSDPAEAIKKRHYRKELSLLEIVSKNLLDRAYNRHHRIQTFNPKFVARTAHLNY
ncbi:MAG: hypothetical protein ABJG41_01420 [Cyclobacteriaceae bacterium]